VEPPAFTPRLSPYLPYAIPLLCKIPSLTTGNRQQHCANSSSPFPDEFVTSTFVGKSPFTVVMVSLPSPSPAPEPRRLTTQQDWEQEFRPQGMQMMQKPQTLSFLGRRSFVPRPMSEATEIFDTDNEDESTDDGSPPRSMGSVGSPPPTWLSSGAANQQRVSWTTIAKPPFQHRMRSTHPVPVALVPSSSTLTTSQ
jgi:hypothetical protein